MKLAGLREVADIAEVSRQRASEIVEKDDFPKPLDRIAAGPVWEHGEVTAWVKAWKRKKKKR